MPVIDSWPELPAISTTVKSLAVTVDILPSDFLDLQKDLWTPRLLVDGTEVQIRDDAVITEGENDIGESLAVTLLKPSDRSLFTSSASIDFGIGKKVAGVWDSATFIDLMLGGLVDSDSETIAGPPNQVKDRVKVSIISAGVGKLAKTSLNGTIIYDSGRVTLDPTEITPLRDADGNLYSKEIISTVGMTLGFLFNEIFITKLGFSSVHTDLPANDWPIEKYEVGIGERYYDGLKGFMGVYEPAITIIGDEVWVLDPSKPQPVGFPAPAQISPDRPPSIQLDTQKQRLDAYNVQYSGLENNYDYTTFAYDYLDKSNGNISRTLEKITIEFRKKTSPTTNVIVRSQLNIENQVTSYFGIGSIQERSEVNEFDAKGQLASNRKQSRKLLPFGTLVYDSTAVQNFETETENYEYAAHPFKPRTDYVARRDYKKTGLVAKVLTSIVAIGSKPLQIKADVAARSGWVTTTTTVDDVVYDEVDTLTKEETSQPLRNGMVRVHTFEVDELLPAVINDSTEDRAGEVGTSTVANHQDQILVFATGGASRTNKRVEDINIGPLPLKYGIALMRRKLLQRAADIGSVTIPVFGYDSTLAKGFPITPFDRDGNALGTFIIRGRTITINARGVVMNLTGRVMAASEQSLQEVESQALVIPESTTFAFTLPIDCTTGYSLFVLPSSISDLTVLARHGHSGGHTNLLSSSLSLTAWDGTTQDFDFEITTGAVAVKTRVEFQIIVDFTDAP